MHPFLTILKSCFVVSIAFFAPIQGLLAATLGLMFIDLVTGLIKAKHQDILITSTGMKRTVSKAFLYFLAIIAGFLIEYLVPGILPVAKLVAGVITLTEATSIYENISAVTGINFTQLSTILSAEVKAKEKIETSVQKGSGE